MWSMRTEVVWNTRFVDGTTHAKSSEHEDGLRNTDVTYETTYGRNGETAGCCTGGPRWRTSRRAVGPGPAMTSSDGQSRRPARTSCDSRCVRAPVSDDPRITGAAYAEHIVHAVQIPRRAAVARPQVRWSSRAGRDTPSERRVGRPDGHRDERTLPRRRELVCPPLTALAAPQPTAL